MELDSEGFIQQRRLPDRRLIAVDPLLFDRARLGIGMLPPMNMAGVFADTWEFPNIGAALLALETWEPDEQKEPTGWDRHPGTMRYRIGGDATLEYVKRDGDMHEQVRYAIKVIAGENMLAMIDSSGILGASFPKGSRLFEVLTAQHEYNVYLYLDRCVVIPEEEMQNISVGNVIKRLAV
jgi:hypothetical protein